jgi:hypothetical protein
MDVLLGTKRRETNKGNTKRFPTGFPPKTVRDPEECVEDKKHALVPSPRLTNDLTPGFDA